MLEENRKMRPKREKFHLSREVKFILNSCYNLNSFKGQYKTGYRFDPYRLH